jgi:hypothetical protein
VLFANPLSLVDSRLLSSHGNLAREPILDFSVAGRHL